MKIHSDILIKWVSGVMCLIHTCSGYPLSVTNGSMMNPEMQKGYVRMFFMPVQAATPEETELSYHINYPPLRDDLSQALPSQVQPYSFWGSPLTSASMDPELITLEESLANVTDSFTPSSELMKMTMENVFNKPRNKLTHPSNRELVGGYIYERFGRSGLIVTMQDFEHELPLKEYAKIYFDETLTPIVETGTNLIGILPGKYWNTENDKPIIVGAHWDSVANTTGFDDNGSGVTVLLEIARVLSLSKQQNNKPCFTPDFSIIFVAFDSEEPGSFGSLQFIRKFLSPNFLKKGVTIQGAIILDTIMNVDFLDDSQDVPEDWYKLAPEAADSIEKDKFRGNFVALIGRRHPQEIYLNQVLRKWWEQTHQEQGYPYIRPLYFELEKLSYEQNPTPDVLLEHSYFWLSDHSRFWYYQEEEETSIHLPAILFTDTAFHRGYMRDCYHRSCDTFNEEKTTSFNYFLLEKIARTLIWTISEISMDAKSPLNPCLSQTIFSLPKRTPIPGQSPDISIPALSTTTTRPTTTATTTKPVTKLPEKPPTAMKDVIDVEELDVNKPNQIEDAFDSNGLQLQKNIPYCSGDHCHQKSEEIDNEINKYHDFQKFGPAFLSLVDKLNYIKGPQINIENLHLDFSTNNIFQGQSDETKQQMTPGILVGPGKIDPTILARVIESLFNSNLVDDDKPDRRKYKGKNQEHHSIPNKMPNSPIVIQLKN